MSARDIVGGLAGAAVGAVKHPVGTAGGAVSKARTAVGAGTAVGTAVAGTVFRRVRGDAGEVKDKAAGAAKETAGATKDKAAGAAKETAGAAKDKLGVAKETAGKAKEATVDVAQTTTEKAEDAAKSTADVADKATDKVADRASGAAKKATKKAPAKKSPAKKGPANKSGKKAAAKREPQVVFAEPAPPLEPPIDVVGQALAAEAKDPNNIGFGRTTEPRGASRDEEHGEASLQPAEVNEIAEEMAEVARAGNLDLSTPVGTTGADTGFNPDTAEADLQQPGTEPLVDPALTNEVKSEQKTLSQAAAPKKPRPKKTS